MAAPPPNPQSDALRKYLLVESIGKEPCVIEELDRLWGLLTAEERKWLNDREDEPK